MAFNECYEGSEERMSGDAILWSQSEFLGVLGDRILGSENEIPGNSSIGSVSGIPGDRIFRLYSAIPGDRNFDSEWNSW